MMNSKNEILSDAFFNQLISSLQKEIGKSNDLPNLEACKLVLQTISNNSEKYKEKASRAISNVDNKIVKTNKQKEEKALKEKEANDMAEALRVAEQKKKEEKAALLAKEYRSEKRKKGFLIAIYILIPLALITIVILAVAGVFGR